MTAPRIRFRQISKSYPGVRALDEVSFDVAPASVHALVGENGAGKSTLMKVLAGATRADAGAIELDGETVAIGDARHAQQLGISIVYQEFNLVRDMSVAENILLGRWPRGRSGLIDYVHLHAEANRVLASLGIDLPVRRTVAGLSVAQQQMVEIAKALSLKARVLVLDEPSAVLTPHELRTLFGVVADARWRGLGVLYISHRLEEIFEIADAVTVLRDGRHVSTRAVGDVSRGALIAEMVGRELKDEFPRREARPSDVMLRVEGLAAAGRFDGVSFDVRAGEVFGLTGLVGAGRTSVARTIFGAVRASGGRVEVGAARGPFRSPRAALAAGVMMLPEDRRQEGLLLERPVRENVTLACREAVATAGFVQRGRERALVERLTGELRVRAAGIEVRAATLSGGNQQKVLLARCLSQPRRVVILDEPTRGVDVGAKYEIYTLINRLAADGMAILMISSELPEVIGMSDRVGVMHEGRLAGVLDNAGRGVTQEQIMRLASGERGGAAA